VEGRGTGDQGGFSRYPWLFGVEGVEVSTRGGIKSECVCSVCLFYWYSKISVVRIGHWDKTNLILQNQCGPNRSLVKKERTLGLVHWCHDFTSLPHMDLKKGGQG
jgi:hypothetical protein